MNTSNSELSLDGLPPEFGQASRTAEDASNFPAIPGYRIQRLLGKGGMGAVYEVVCGDELTTRLALKVLFVPRFRAVPREIRSRFERELSLLASLNHSNIVPVVDQGSFEQDSQSIPFFTMPLIDKGDLSDELTSNPVVTVEQVRTRIEQLCGVLDGLEHAHTLGIVHRDIKPRNILVASDGSLLLGDFGLAKLLQTESELTSTIGHMGTTPYAPPEQLLSAKLAGKTADIFSIGVILYEIVCFGKRPFSPEQPDADSSSETDSIARWQTSLDRIPPAPSKRLQNLSDKSLDYIIQKCMSYYPEHRYQSASDLAVDLRAWLRGEAVHGTLAERFRARILLPLRKYWIAATAVAVAVTLLASAILWNRFHALESDVSKLKSDKASLRAQAIGLSSHRAAELRRELDMIYPQLQGEERDFEIRRLLNPSVRFAELNERAREIAHELELENSSSLRDRHLFWAILRSEKSAYPDAEYINHVRALISYSEATLQLAKGLGIEEQSLALSDLLRSLRMLPELSWALESRGWATEYGELIDVARVTQEVSDTLDRYSQLAVVTEHAPSNRHWRLLRLELRAKSSKLDEQQVVDLCKDNMFEFTASALERDQCEQLHPWYLAWYLFEQYYETANSLGVAASELVLISKEWQTVSELRPSLSKTRNLVHQMDVIVAQDRHGDALRKLGRLDEARVLYQANWTLSKQNLSFYTLNPNAWNVAEQSISSMNVLAEITGDSAERISAYEQEVTLYRDMIREIEENPEAFGKAALEEAKYELADSLTRLAALMKGQVRVELLDQARGLLQGIVDLIPKSVELLRHIESVRNRKN